LRCVNDRYNAPSNCSDSGYSSEAMANCGGGENNALTCISGASNVVVTLPFYALMSDTYILF